MLNTQTALIHTVVFGGVIFLCRSLPFILFREKTGLHNNNENKKERLKSFFEFVESAVPAVAMTVLAFNALASPVKEAVDAHTPNMTGIITLGIIPLAAAALITAVLHIWKRNPLFSILGGTALYMLLTAII